MQPLNLTPLEIKAYVPARDFELSKNFYQAMGFTMGWGSEHMAYFHFGYKSFLLQNFHVQQHTENFMMHLLVENADDWHQHLTDNFIAERFGVAISLPEDRPWDMRDFTLCDPSGVLWRIGHSLS